MYYHVRMNTQFPKLDLEIDRAAFEIAKATNPNATSSELLRIAQRNKQTLQKIISKKTFNVPLAIVIVEAVSCGQFEMLILR